MASELSFRAEAAAGYDRALSHVSAHFLPFLLRAAALAPGHSVLDVATGTGIAAEAAIGIVGSDGSVIATDISPEMVGRAHERLDRWPNATVTVEDGQALSFSDGSFDAVLCSIGLMFFPDPGRALCGFHRVLRRGGRAAVSVLTAPEQSYNGRINVIVARHVPGLAQATARTFALGDATKLRLFFAEAGFREIESGTEKHTFILPSFDSYYGPFEHGGGSTGQALASLPEATRQAIRGETQQSLGYTGGPVEIEVEMRIASARG
jgi:ubiquinone/menaquinone biosynthesis C-methylase UbiE